MEEDAFAEFHTPMPEVDWDIRREGRAWDDEAFARMELVPEKA